jgi:RHS repeat-associated protein
LVTSNTHNYLSLRWHCSSFGSRLAGDVFASTYRYGYQGSEREPQVLSNDGYSTEYRILDTRIGRWFSTDPIEHPWQSPYTSMDNSPIALNDVLGLSTGGEDKKKGGKKGKQCNPHGAGDGKCKHGETDIHTINEKNGKLRKFSQKAANLFAAFGKSSGEHLISSYKKNVGNDILKQGPSSFVIKEERFKILEQRLKNSANIFEYQQMKALIDGVPLTRDQGKIKKEENPTLSPVDQMYHNGGADLIAEQIAGTWIFKGGGKLFTLLNESGVSSSIFAKGGTSLMKFGGDEAVVHFGRHGKSVMTALGKHSYNLKTYVQDANYIIKYGTYVPKLNGYVRFIGGSGSIKFGFVGLNRATGEITTFHIKTVQELAKKVPDMFGY